MSLRSSSRLLLDPLELCIYFMKPKSPRSIKTLLEISLDLARMAKSHDCNKSHDRPTYVRRHCQLKYKHVNNIHVAKMYFALFTSTLMKNHQTYAVLTNKEIDE